MTKLRSVVLIHRADGLSDSESRRLAVAAPRGPLRWPEAGDPLPKELVNEQRESTPQANPRLRVALWMLLLCFFVVGVFGRFPWKADEPYSFGIVMEMLEDGQWLVPHVADQSFLEKPPLVYWLGAASASAFAGVPPHESSRLAVLILVAATVLALYRSAGHLWLEADTWRRWLASAPTAERSLGVNAQRDHSLFAVLLFAGTLGVTEQVHKLTADLGQLAGCVIALCGLVRLGTLSAPGEFPARRAASIAGMTVGTGAGVAFMSKGVLVPALILLTWAACLALPAYRNSAAKTAAWAALAFALPWLVIWPVLLHVASPELLKEWFWANNVGRFLGQGNLGGTGVSVFDRIIALALAAVPAWPLCVTVVARTWRGRKSTGWSPTAQAPAHTCVVAFLIVSLVVLVGSRSFRDNYLLPVLPALVLLGLPGFWVPSGRLGPIRKRATDNFFALLVAIAFAVWLQLVMASTIWPSTLGVKLGKILPLPFHLEASWPSLALAVTAVLLWQYARRGAMFRGATASWCIGLAMLWTVSFSLLLPWIDAARSYEAVFTDFRSKLGNANCLATSGLGESELAMLEYVGGMEITRLYPGRSGSGDHSRFNRAASECDWLLVLSKPASALPEMKDPTWQRVWHGSRPADANERFDLYRRP